MRQFKNPKRHKLTGRRFGRWVVTGTEADYTKGLENCVSCCKICNVAKRRKTKSEFLAWINRVYNYVIAPKRRFTVRPAPCTIYLVEGKQGEVWIPCDANGLSDELFLAFTTKQKAQEHAAIIWRDRDKHGISDIRIGRRVARSAVKAE